jgi:ribokinase
MSHAGFVAGSSGTASIVVDARGENTIIATPGSNLQVTHSYLRSKLDVLRSAGMILAQLEVLPKPLAGSRSSARNPECR